MKTRPRAVPGLFIAAVLLLSVTATAQTHSLQLESDHFVIDGQAKMLLVASYFDAMREYDWSPTELRADFDYLKAHRINAVRIFPNWWVYNNELTVPSPSPFTLFSTAGCCRAGRMAALRGVLDTAQAAGLVVDVSFSRETVFDGQQRMDIGPYSAAIQSVAAQLRNAYPLVFFDIQNERTKTDTWQHLDTSAVLAIRNAAKSEAGDPARLVTVSDEGDDWFACKQLYFDASLDLVTYHDPRGTGWQDRTATVIQNLWYAIQAWRPVYLQEPEKWENDPTPGHYMVAADTAKRYGAAGWTVHAANPGFKLENRNYRNNLQAGQVQVLEWFRDTLPLTGWSACNFYASPGYVPVPTSGGDFSIYFSTRWGCSSAALIDPSTPWIHVVGPDKQHAYEGYYYFHVDPSGGPRDTVIWVADQAITIHQG